MTGENRYLDYYVLWCYLILIASNALMAVMGYDEKEFSKMIALVVHGGIFWYWYKDKDYKLWYWILAGILAKVCRYAFIFILALSLPYGHDNSASINFLAYTVGVILSFVESYFYQLFKIKSYKNQNKQEREQ